MNTTAAARARIRQRRAQMLAHSYLYYWLDSPIISDHQWQAWADELAAMQKAHPGGVGFYDPEFADWDGSTGMHLPNDGSVAGAARHLLALHTQYQQPVERPAAPVQMGLF